MHFETLGEQLEGRRTFMSGGRRLTHDDDDDDDAVVVCDSG